MSRFVPNSVEILTCDFDKKLFRENFSENLCKTKAILYENFWKFALLSAILFCLRLVLKNSEKITQVLSYVVCTQLRRHVHKQITKNRYRREKPGRFDFGKPVLLTLGLELTTPYSLDLLVCNFSHTFVIVCVEFWMRFEPQIKNHKICNNFLFITAKVERKVPLCVKLFGFFPKRILICLTCNLSRFVPNLVEILTWDFDKKLFREIFSKNMCNTKKKFQILPYFLQFSSGSVLH